MAKTTLTAKVGAPAEMLIGEGSSQTVARVRKIEIIENGKRITTLTSADSQADIHAQIDKAGFILGKQDGDSISLTRKPMNGSQKMVLGCAGFFVLIMVLLFGGCAALMANGNDKADEPTDYDAKYYCQEFVKEKLKAPSTAKFSKQIASGGGSSWTSSGTVEAQNSFGGTVSSRYSCTLSYNSAEKSWTGVATLLE